ncbi:unnamed protein product, partial [Brassica oleracea]
LKRIVTFSLLCNSTINPIIKTTLHLPSHSVSFIQSHHRCRYRLEAPSINESV